MPLESGTFINDLVITNPAAGDVKGEGDDHLRLIKKTLKNSFPNLSGALNRLVLKNSNYTVVATDSYSMFSCGNGMTLSLTAAATLGNNFMIGIHADGNDFTIDPAGAELVNGQTSLVIEADSWGYLFCNGTSFSLVQTIPVALARVYPVGSIYMNASNAANPASLFGFGTWVAFGAGRMPVGFNDADPLFNSAEEIGGSKDAVVVSHTHTGSTTSEGEHNHLVGFVNATGIYNSAGGNGPNTSSPGNLQTTSTGGHSHSITTNSTGVSAINANLPPYITVYMWKRTA